MNVKRFIHIWTIAILFLLFDVNIAKAASSCPLDSVLTYDINSVLTEVTIYDYDDAGHTISEVVWTVNADGSRIGKSKKEDQYEGNTQVMTSTYVWDNSTSDWKGSAKTEYEFANGKNTATTVFDWLNGTWSAKSKETYVYDGAGRETQYTTYARNASGQLAYNTRREKTYNTAGKLILDIIYNSYANGAWVGSSKYVYDYNASGTQTLYEYYSSYTNGAWVGSTRNVYEFDAAGNKTLEEKYSGMSGGKWKGSSKYTATFNANKKEIERIVFKWNTTSKTWQNNTKTNKAYDGNNVTDDASYTWSSNKWTGKSRTSKTYSGTLVTSEIVWKWSNGWVHNTKTETQYSGSNISIQTKFVWKNSAWVNVSQLTNTYVSNRLTEANTKAWRSGAWQDSLRITHGFNAKGIDTLAITSTWNNSAWIPKDSTTREVTYIKIGSKDYVTEDVSMKWVSTTNLWTGVSRETKEYDTSGNVIQSDTYSWASNTGWVNNVRRHYAYKDGNKNLETLNDYLTWNKTTNVWVGNSRTEKKYDATNRLVRTSTYTWSISHNDWSGLSSAEDIYENGLKVTYIAYTWDATDWQWIGMGKHDYSYTSSGKLAEQIVWRYNKTDGWYYDTRVTNTYDSKGRTSQTINYQWIAASSQWCMTSKNQTTYDADADGGRLREQLNATGSNCAVTSYALKHYMYGCDQITIRFVNYDGTVLDTQILEKGVTPVYNGATPTREGGPDVTYSFVGWTPEIVPVNGNATYTATYASSTNSYTITWLNDDGTTIDQTTLGYGVMPTHADATKVNTAEYTYEFMGWTPGLGIVTGDATYQATFKSTKNKYTITWLDDDNTQIDQTSVEYGVVPEHADATKEATSESSYTFAGWTPELVPVTGEATYTATFTPSTRKYTISWLDDDDTQIDQTFVEYGIVPTHDDPSKTATAEFTYTFAGWDVTPVAVTGDATYKATYSAAKNSYTITWLDDDNSSLGTTTVEYGIVPTHADPTKAATAEFTYTFAGWNNTPVAVTGEATYKATYTSAKNSYTITWLDDDDSSLGTTIVEYGIVPTHDDPSKAATAEFTYAFAGWDNTPVAVTGEATYKATYSSTKNKYTITWLNDDETQIDQTSVEYGVVPTHDDPSKATTAEFTYTFAGWDNTPIAVTGEATYKATYSATKNKYTITWLDDDNTQIDQTSVEYGVVPTHDDPAKQATAEFTYTFTGWDNTPIAVVGEATYKATYSAAKNSYTIIWLDDDNSSLGSTTVEYGIVPTHEDPTKQPTAQYGYTFAGWSPAVTSVTGNATYKATYTDTINQYTISWLDDTGTLVDQTKVAYGATPAHANIYKESDDQFDYTFVGWTPTLVPVTGDASYSAIFTTAGKSYTVTFYFEDGVTILDQMTLPYGAIPSTPYIPSIPSDANHTYTFSGWSPEIAPVTGDISYVPTFTAIPNQYTVIFRNYNGKELQRKKVDYGTIPEYEGDEPSHPATNSYTWTFEGWTPELVAVIGDATYTAVYTKVMNTYTILFYDEDGTTLLDEVTVEHGQKPTTSVIPTKEADEEYRYTFAGWNPKIVKATMDATYTATYTATPKTQDLNNTEAEERATKVLIDDHIYILRAGHTYTLDGTLVE